MIKIKKSLYLIFSILFFFSCTKNSAFMLKIPDCSPSSVSSKKSSGRTEFLFSQGQKKNIHKYIENSREVALKITLLCKNVKNTGIPGSSKFEIGFLFNGEKETSLVSGFFADFASAPFSVIFCFEKGAPVPGGFFIQTTESFSVQSAEIIPAVIGFDFSESVPVFAFAPNGGIISPKVSRADFSGASLVFDSVTSYNSLMPQMEITYSGKTKISVSGEQFTVRPSESGSIKIPFSAFKTPFSQVSVIENENAVSSILVRASDRTLLSFFKNTRFAAKPIKADPGLILKWQRTNWRGNDYELFEWDRFPGILIFDIADYKIQDDFFRRMAYFVEKAGYKGQLLSDKELDGKHGYNAHDYKCEDMARFFEKARSENFKLNEKEELLKQILLHNGQLVLSEAGTITAGKGAVISISQESPEYLRRQLLAHEGWHGIYFTDDDFRNIVASIYYTIDPNTRKYLIRYFQVTPSLNYDTTDEYLLKNEFMAYLLQQPVSSTSEYFLKMARREHSQQLAKEEADYVISTDANGFTSAAAMLDEYVNSRWGLNGGRIWLVN